MATKKVTLLELDIDNSQVLKKRAENIKQTNKLIQTQKDLKKSTENLTTATDAEAQAYAKNEAELKRLQAEGRKYAKVLQDQKTAQQSNLRIVEKTDGSINSLRNAVNINKQAYQSLSKEQRNNEDVGGKLLKTIEAQDSEYKELSRSIGNNQVDVGNYKIATEGLTKNLNVMGVNLGNVANQLKAKRTALQAAKASLSGTTKGLKLFRIALISTGIGAIVVAIGALVSAFASTQKGADAISRALAPVKGALQGIISVIQKISTNVFGTLGDRFTVVKNGILQGIDTIRLGWNKLTGDIEEANEIQERMNERIKETTEAQIRLNQASGELGEIFAGASKEIQEAIDRQEQIVELGIEAEELAIANVYAQGRLTNEIKAQNKVAEDVTKPLKEREQATIRSIEASKELLKSEQDLLAVKIKQLKLEQQQTDTSREDLLELANLEKEFNDKETQALELQTTQTNKLNTIRNQARAEAKKAQAERIKKLKEELDIQETIVEQNIELLNQELQVYLLNNKTKLESTQKLNKESIDLEIKRLGDIKERQTKINEEELQATKDKLANELRLKEISQAEYENSLKIAQNEFDIIELERLQSFSQSKLDLDKQYLAQKAEAEEIAKQNKIAKDIEERANKIARLQLEGAEESVIRQAQLDEQLRKEVEQAEKIGADTNLVYAKFAEKEVEIAKAKEDAKLQATATVAGQLKGLFDENTLAYKLSAITEASISTYLSAQKAYQSLIGIPVTGPVLAPIAAATAITSGLLNVKKISGFAEGTLNVQDYTNHTGIINGKPNIRRSNGDNILATIKTGETISTPEHRQRITDFAGFDLLGHVINGYANGTTSVGSTTQKVINSNIVGSSGIGNKPIIVSQTLDIKDLVRESMNYQNNQQDVTV